MTRFRHSRWVLGAAVFALALSGCASTPKRNEVASGSDRVRKLEVRRIGPDYLVRIQGEQKPTFTVFRLVNPMRVVLDLANYDVRALARPRLIEDGAVARIRGRQFGDENLGIGRIELQLRGLAEFDSWVDGNAVVVRIKPVRADLNQVVALTQADDAILLEEPTEGEDLLLEEEFIEDIPEDDLFADDVDLFAEEPTLEELEAPAAEQVETEDNQTAEPALEEPVLEEPAVAEPALEEPVLEEPAVAEPVLEEPVLEEPAVAEPVLEEPVLEEPAVAEPAEKVAPEVLPGEEPIDLAEPIEPYTPEAEPFAEELPPIVEESEEERLAQETLEGMDADTIEAAAKPMLDEPPVRASQLLDVVWEVRNDATIVTIEANGPFGDYNAFKLESPPRVVVDIWDVSSLIPGEEFILDAAQVKAIRVGEYPEKVRIVLDMPGGTQALPFTTEKSDNKLIVRVTGAAGGETVAEAKPVIEVASEEPVVPGPIVVAETAAAQPAKARDEQVEPIPVPQKAAEVGARSLAMKVETPKRLNTSQDSGKEYKGRKISLDFKDADIDSVLRLIAEVSNLNIITDQEVSGTISLRLVNVPWDQALDVVLNTKQLGIRKMGNIVRVAPLKKLLDEDQARLKALDEQDQLLPLFIRVVPVNYAAAADIAKRIEALLSERGKVDVDTRTNVLIIKDIERNIEDAVALVRSLDTPTPQVLIEAKIVEANTTFTRDLGIQWGYGQGFAPEFGQNNLPGRIGIGGASAGNVGFVPDAQNFAVDLPAAVGQGSGGALGFVFGSLDNSMALSLRLSALEQVGEGRIISSPRVTTLDNEKATILQGISIPFQTVSASGTQTQFVDAALRLEVTPHITPDRSILLDFKISKNAPDQTFTAGTGVPSISKKEAQSRMLVQDGETAVVGGIFTIDRGSTQQRVPWLSRIPVLGWFFQKRTSRDTKTELLLFVTPRIVEK